MKNITGKKILITGATSGLGRSILKKIWALGAVPAFCGRSEEKMKLILDEAGPLLSKKHHYGIFDFTDEEAIVNFIRDAEKNLGPVDILINCAGINSARCPAEEITTGDLEYMLRVNLTAPFIFMRELLKGMKERKSGQIININSTVSLYSNSGIGAYTASKGGFDALTGVIRREVRDFNIRVCSVYPGGIDTPFRETARPDYMNADSAAEAVISVIAMNESIAVDELVIRPYIEKNFR